MPVDEGGGVAAAEKVGDGLNKDKASERSVIIVYLVYQYNSTDM